MVTVIASPLPRHFSRGFQRVFQFFVIPSVFDRSVIPFSLPQSPVIFLATGSFTSTNFCAVRDEKAKRIKIVPEVRSIRRHRVKDKAMPTDSRSTALFNGETRSGGMLMTGFVVKRYRDARSAIVYPSAWSKIKDDYITIPAIKDKVTSGTREFLFLVDRGTRENRDLAIECPSGPESP